MAVFGLKCPVCHAAAPLSNSADLDRCCSLVHKIRKGLGNLDVSLMEGSWKPPHRCNCTASKLERLDCSFALIIQLAETFKRASPLLNISCADLCQRRPLHVDHRARNFKKKPEKYAAHSTETLSYSLHAKIILP